MPLNGDACRFSHASLPASTLHPQPDPRSQVPCKFYPEGICKQGANCPYRHELSSPSFPAHVPPEHDNDTFVRVFRGAVVRYGDGACVTGLSLPFEYSSVRLDGLAADTTPADVISILENLGHDIEVDGLRIVAMPQSSLCSAYISTPDLEFSKTLSASLLDTPHSKLRAVPVPPRLPPWASTRRARCNKLQLRWTARSECRMFFTSYMVALRVSDKFNEGKYQVQNTRVRCDYPVPIGFGTERPVGYSVTLSGLPYRCSEEMVQVSITNNYDAPLDIIVQRRSACKKDTTASIKDLLSGVGPISFMTEPQEHNGPYWTAFAQFQQDCDAHEAAQIIEKKSHNLAYDVDLTARLSYNTTFRISKEVYHHVRQRLQDCFNNLDSSRINVISRETGMVLSLDNWSSTEVVKCANTIEDIVAGDVIEGKDSKPFWVPQLERNGSASKPLKEIQQRHGVLLLPNRSKREVRYFGSSAKRTAVQEDMVRSLTEEVARRYTIDIDDHGFSWLCKTGLDLLKDVVGAKLVSIDVTSNPRKLVIIGSDEEYCQILVLLEMCDVSFDVKEVGSEESCSICFTPADNPVVLGCGHVYCADCFKGLCKNGVTHADMSVACTGAEDKCKNAIPLREIQAHTDPSSFEQLLESSFSAYIARRPNQFHYCPTPDCGYIYRPSSESASSLWHMCSKCLQWICRSCHVNHDGQRCDEHRAFQAFETYKHENSSNVKDCPKCQTTVEKIDGCNHLQCGGCNIHLCWVCLQTFEDSPACYGHMTEVHGGIGVDDVPEGDDDDNDDDD
ncbi:putative ariadne RING finger [Rosellinia necatrix]|uniref:Putative ariadne RING finger n=1 Tax=Rosellinia necatrix TaxID=77044 RepID=A0A1W2TBZ5_ROSNE|nr:putative ariadne RING finger [Rosellinia necatrix]